MINYTVNGLDKSEAKVFGGGVFDGVAYSGVWICEEDGDVASIHLDELGLLELARACVLKANEIIAKKGGQVLDLSALNLGDEAMRRGEEVAK